MIWVYNLCDKFGNDVDTDLCDDLWLMILVIIVVMMLVKNIANVLDV